MVSWQWVVRAARCGGGVLVALLALGAAGACGGRSNLDGGEGGAVPPGEGPRDGNGSGNGSGSGNGNGNGSGNGNGMIPGSGSAGSSSSDPGGGSEPGPGVDPDPDPDPDPGSGSDPGSDPGNPNCVPGNAKGGMACTAPCVTTCGYQSMGTRACDCVSGVFVSCSCPRPWNYQGRTTAPRCDTPDGYTHWIDNTPCPEKWAQCIGSDPVAGVNPRGCACLTDPVNGQLEWTCGSTNRWFVPE